MNKKLIYLGIAIIAFCVLGILWIGSGADKNSKPDRQLASAANNIATAAGQAKTQTPPQKQAAAPAPATPPAPAVQAETSSSEDKPPEKATDLPPEELATIRQELKQTVETKFNNDLGFPLDEPKMIAYAQASLKVKKINDKWDVQIAATDTDQTAIEYNNQAVDEITKSLQNMQGLTIEQYNAMTKLTATNAEFNNAYQVYKQLIEEGIIKPAVQSPVPSTPVVAAPVPSMPAAAPADRGTVPVTQGLPAPQYSQQPSR